MARTLKYALGVWLLLLQPLHADCTTAIDALESRLFTHPDDQAARQQLRRLLADPRCAIALAPASAQRSSSPTGQLRLSALWFSNPQYAAESHNLILQEADQVAQYRLDSHPRPQAALQLDLLQTGPRRDAAMQLSLRQYAHLPTDLAMALAFTRGKYNLMFRFERTNQVDGFGVALDRQTALFSGVLLWQAQLWHYPGVAAFDNADITLAYLKRHGRLETIVKMSYLAGMARDYPGGGTLRAQMAGSYRFASWSHWRPTLALQITAEQDQRNWSSLLAYYDARKTLRLHARLQAERPLDNARRLFVRVAYDRQWSSIPLFSWRALALAGGVSFTF